MSLKVTLFCASWVFTVSVLSKTSVWYVCNVWYDRILDFSRVHGRSTGHFGRTVGFLLRSRNFSPYIRTELFWNLIADFNAGIFFFFGLQPSVIVLHNFRTLFTGIGFLRAFMNLFSVFVSQRELVQRRSTSAATAAEQEQKTIVTVAVVRTDGVIHVEKKNNMFTRVTTIYIPI